MGSMIGCCAGQALCCAGQMCCSMLCAPCKAGGVHSKNFAKIGYTFMQISFIILATIFMFNAQWLINKKLYLDNMIDCPTELDLTEAECLGIAIVLRMSFTLFCFHLFIFLVVCARNSMAAAFHDGCWAFKCLLIVGGFALQCTFGNEFYMDFKFCKL